MKLFVDTAEVSDIKDLIGFGLLDGVTTNPSLIAKSGRDFKEVIEEICTLTDTPVSAEVAALDTSGMIAEGKHIAAIADTVIVKLPLTLDGLRACAHFKREGIRTNVTLCFSPNQALLAAKAAIGEFPFESSVEKTAFGRVLHPLYRQVFGESTLL